MKNLLSRTIKNGLNDALEKDISNPLFCKSTKKGSATVEALLILPYIAIFLMFIIWIIDLYTIHAIVGGVVNDVGTQLVTYSYPYAYLIDNGFTEENKKKMATVFTSILFSEGYLKEKVQNTSIGDKLEHLTVIECVDGDHNDISLKVSYYVRPYIDIPGVNGIYLTNSFYSKAYTGYEPIKEDIEDKTVFITQNSEVYHTSQDCKALKSVIEKTSIDAIDGMRNRNGGKYYSCSKCNKKSQSGEVYYTPFGTRYHCDMNCPELRITVYEVPIHEAKERRLCKFCKNK